jgi:protein-tyrosine phosphatase
LFGCGAHHVGRTSVATGIPDLGLEHPAPGTSIVRFAQVDAGVYRGSTPKNDADFKFLQSKQIKHILNLEFLPFLSELEERKAKKYGITVIDALINGSPVAPSEKHVNQILLILRDRRNHPIYFHCALGRDRTSLIAALYKMYFQGMSQQAAWQEMKSFGFKDSWTLGGLKRYFERHPSPPPSLMDHERKSRSP